MEIFTKEKCPRLFGPFYAWNLNNFSLSAIVLGSEKQASQSTLLLQKFCNFEKEVLKAFSFEI